MSSESLLVAKEISLYYLQKEIFSKLDFSLPIKAKIGLAGINGSGKTSLLKVLAGEIEFSEGQIFKPKDLKIQYLPQDFDLPSKSLREFLLPQEEVFKDLELENRVKTLLQSFNLPTLPTALHNLSGGLQRQALLVRVLSKNADLVLLDEPTNHLDFITLLNLQKVLHSYPGTVFIVSHDRYFLDKTVNKIWELDNKKLYFHSTNYTGFLNQKKVRQQTQLKQFEKQKQELRREQEWFREGVRARGTKDQGRLKRYYQLKEAHQNSRPNLENPVLPLPKIQPLGNKILILKNLTVNFIGEERNQRQECIVKDLNLEFEPSFRLGILGANGSGKTTLIQTILGEHSQQSGKIIYGQNTFFNYQDQKRQKLQQETTIIKEISNGNLEMPFGNTKTNVYAYLKKFLFHSQDLTKRIWELSGGQKARVLLAKILKQNGNFLILDEPTNDLDIDTMEALENTLVSFLGCVILVSHDRFFLDRVCTHILALEGEGRYTLSSGGYSRYMQKYGQEQDFWGQQPSRSKATNTPSQKQIKPTKTSSKDKRKARLELRNLEKDISKCQQKIDKLNQLVVAPDFYQKPSQEIRQILGNLDQQKKYLNSLENRWLEISLEATTKL